MKTDIEISRETKLKPILEIAKNIGLKENEIELYGKYKAKISLGVMKRLENKKNAYYIDVTAITPTPLGEGKTVTTIGLAQALCRVGKHAIACIRQPSLGPVFGIKGGAAGGGYSQVVPMEDMNLHLTGDNHAVSIAHNLCTAYLENSILKGNSLRIKPETITWNRVVDINDRFLRHIVIGLGGKKNGFPRETGFEITAASEVMAILGLSKNMMDLRERLGKILLGYNINGKPITAEDIKVAGAMCVLLKDAFKPNLMQTIEHTPCFVHTGPFANIAHGNSSIIADTIALKLSEYVVTESGFGADCGMEKFMDIKCRYSGLRPDCVVIVCTVRALKMHGGAGYAIPGKPLPAELLTENVSAVEIGCRNLIHHIRIAKMFGIPVVVAINRFDTDTDTEIEIIRNIVRKEGVDAVPVEVWRHGGIGGIELAKTVIKNCDKSKSFRFMYPDDMSIEKKIECIATKVYNARGVNYTSTVMKKIKKYTELGYAHLPICIAKTHLSISHNPDWKNVPEDYEFPVTDIKVNTGAGFIVPLAGEMRTMPGLPTHPAGEKIDITQNGTIVGLF